MEILRPLRAMVCQYGNNATVIFFNISLVESRCLLKATESINVCKIKKEKTTNKSSHTYYYKKYLQ